MMMGQIYKKARTNPNFGRSNNEYYNFFLPMEYRITLAIDRRSALMFRSLTASW